MPNTIDIEEHLGLVDIMLRKLFRNWNRSVKEEAKSEGFLALCQAAQKYDPNHDPETSFKRFAGRRIYNRLIDFRFAMSFERVGMKLSRHNLRFLARLEKRSRVLGHWPEYNETEIEAKAYTTTLHSKLREYYAATIANPPASLTPELAAEISTDRRVRAACHGPLVQEQIASDHTRP